jgi:hypothetical protein
MTGDRGIWGILSWKFRGNVGSVKFPVVCTLRRYIMAQYMVDGYAVRLWSTRPTTNLSPGTAVAGIYLYEGKTYRGYVYFFPDGTPLAPPVLDSNKGRIFLHFNLSQFHAVMEMLRNEKPVYVYHLSPTNAALRSGKEPVGEEE